MKLYESSHAQAGQESFVLNALREKKGGYYLEIGGFDAKKLSNTYLLENEFGWSGIAVEINFFRSLKYNLRRKNSCINANALTIDYEEMLNQYNFPNVIDYLQVDIEPSINSFHALCSLPWDTYRFSVITFEHDLYVSSHNSYYKKWSEELLNDLGYVQVVSNVMSSNKNPFEDWWADPKSVSSEFIGLNSSKEVDWRELFH